MDGRGGPPRSPGHSQLIHCSPTAYDRIPLQFDGQHFSYLTTVSQVTSGEALLPSACTADVQNASGTPGVSAFRVGTLLSITPHDSVCGSGCREGAGHSAYITNTLGPFVLSDPGLLSCFQTGRNTRCSQVHSGRIWVRVRFNWRLHW